jgi:hypothetical protein|tara:strand:- start:968 stop:1228 length:261 start_codon:yes stop_codon:yes gene_type:complete
MANQLVKKGPGKKRKGYKGEWWDSGLARFLTPLGRDRKWYSRASNAAGWALPYIWNIPLGGKDGGRVTPKGIGKAKRGFGRAMRKK